MTADTDRRLAALKRRLAAIPAALIAKLEPVVEASANELVEMQRRLAPVDKGDLQASLVVLPGDHVLARQIRAGGKNAHHARWAEFGTANMPAHPFFWVSFRALRKRIKSRLSRAAGKAIREIRDGA